MLGELTMAGRANPTSEEIRALVTDRRYRDLFAKYLRDKNAEEEIRALTSITGTEGGYLLPESELHDQFVTRLDEACPYRQYCTVIGVTRDRGFPVPAFDGTAYWGDEGEPVEESDESVEMKAAHLQGMRRMIKVSSALVQDSAYDLEGFLALAFARSFAKLEEPAFTSGIGHKRPLGWTKNCETGVVTADVDAITSDEVTEMYYKLPAPYRQRAIWMLHDDTTKYLRLLKDGSGRHLYHDSEAPGRPAMLMGRPVVPCNSMQTLDDGEGAVLAGFGDFSYYYIADRGLPELQKLSELYIVEGKVAYIMHRRIDGILTVPEAIQKLVAGAELEGS